MFPSGSFFSFFINSNSRLVVSYLFKTKSRMIAHFKVSSHLTINHKTSYRLVEYLKASSRLEVSSRLEDYLKVSSRLTVSS